MDFVEEELCRKATTSEQRSEVRGGSPFPRKKYLRIAHSISGYVLFRHDRNIKTAGFFDPLAKHGL